MSKVNIITNLLTSYLQTWQATSIFSMSIVFPIYHFTVSTVSMGLFWSVLSLDSISIADLKLS